MWNAYELDLINYQNKCRLIRGWDDLFNKVKEHINSVSAMKLSPYYKVSAAAFVSYKYKYIKGVSMLSRTHQIYFVHSYIPQILTPRTTALSQLPPKTRSHNNHMVIPSSPLHLPGV